MSLGRQGENTMDYRNASYIEMSTGDGRDRSVVELGSQVWLPATKTYIDVVGLMAKAETGVLHYMITSTDYGQYEFTHGGYYFVMWS